MKARMDAIIKTGYERELYARESEIQALNVQLNPHFLYNTLGSFHFLALESGNAKLSRLIMALCRMLQYTSYQGDEMTTLREDVKWLENYLLIMKERVSDLFKIHLDLDDSLMDMCVPKLFLQPFVENALRYALDPNKPFVNLRIMGLRQGQYAVFEVRDDGKGMEQAQVNAILSGRGRSVGIVNVQRRLKLIYEGQASLQIISNIGNGMHVIIQIPVN